MRVDDLITMFGTPVKLKKLAPDQPGFDELRGEWIGEPVYTEEEIVAIVRPLHLTEEQIVAGREVKEIVEVITTARVEKGDRIEVDGRTYRVLEIKRVYSGASVLYTKAVGEYEGEG